MCCLGLGIVDLVADKWDGLGVGTKIWKLGTVDIKCVCVCVKLNVSLILR